jgi:hypothetical protein
MNFILAFLIIVQGLALLWLSADIQERDEELNHLACQYQKDMFPNLKLPNSEVTFRDGRTMKVNCELIN